MKHSDNEILDYLETSDLTQDMKYLEAHIGLDAVKVIMDILGGQRISIPKPSSYKPIALKRFLEGKKIDFNQIEIKKLSRRFDLNENTCRKIIKEFCSESEGS